VGRQIEELRGEIAVIYRTEASGRHRKVVAIEFPLELVESIGDWSNPVQLRFREVADGIWTMDSRTPEATPLQSMVAQRAARQ
jgi:hypothetical protein